MFCPKSPPLIPPIAETIVIKPLQGGGSKISLHPLVEVDVSNSSISGSKNNLLPPTPNGLIPMVLRKSGGNGNENH